LTRPFLPAASAAYAATFVTSALICLLAALALAPEAIAQEGDAPTGIIDVKANVDAALVLLDGELLGEAPLSEIVPAGRHVLRVERDGFEAWEQPLELGVDALVEVTAKLARIDPALEITVDVEGAKVFLDGKQVGEGRRVLVDPAPPGSHELRVEAEPYGSWSSKVTLQRGTVTPVEVAMRGNVAALEIRSDPAGARVWLDGKDAGSTPVTLEPLSPGSHSLRIRAEGRSEFLQTVVVEQGRRAAVDTMLVEEGGSLDVKPSVEDARVYVNGVDVGSGRQSLDSLKPGSYSVRVTAPGHTDFVRSVALEAGRRESVTARLESFEERDRLAGGDPVPVGRRPAFWAGVGGGAGAVAAAVIITAVAVNAQQPPDDGDGEGPEPVAAPPSDFRFTLP
jgi:hypothetical protein